VDLDEPKWRRKKPKRLTFRARMGLAEIIEFLEVLQEIGIKPIEIAMLLKKQLSVKKGANSKQAKAC
jgi:hypothetical protein